MSLVSPVSLYMTFTIMSFSECCLDGIDSACVSVAVCLVGGPTPRPCWWQPMERSWQRQRDHAPTTG